jgi:hypothetical protein
MSDIDRGIGRTSKQIMTAPQGAFYICGNRLERDYAQRLATNLGRHDLKFETLSFFEHGRWRGQRKSLVMDHAAYNFMNNRQREGMMACIIYLKIHQIPVECY